MRQGWTETCLRYRCPKCGRELSKSWLSEHLSRAHYLHGRPKSMAVSEARKNVLKLEKRT